MNNLKMINKIEKIQKKEKKDQLKMLYEWTKTNQVNLKEFKLLTNVIFKEENQKLV